ncbi:A disintegrin and metalloproteinase with thrombospondin motifs 9 [Labeo rohita]|uniref:A disintegrin and metalloproteinase with thrombospondin motifs 9 n=1 Tax=Labeo rohita TaxID=84645 RepID=A0ABQ8LD86_LABRO|nr:A disintegrin and metalloproteinase with thrombospondin motifs 9 [Labeo rohita]
MLVVCLWCVQCSASCGKGIKERQIVCVDQNRTQIEDDGCAHLTPPRTQKVCRAGPCPAWRAHQWRAVCDITSFVVRSNHAGHPGSSHLYTHSCPSFTPKPCHDPPSFPSASGSNHLVSQASVEHEIHQRSGKTRFTSEHGRCSVSCGSGLQSREVFCRLKGRGRVSDDLCDARARPERLQSCFHTDCQTHSWTAHEWKDCNVSCGRGVRSRSVFCVDGGMNVVPDSTCDASIKPQTHEPCHSATCQYVWITTAWSQCSVSCGSGLERRAVHCSAVTSDLQTYSHAAPSDCTERPPADSRPCRLSECPSAGRWSAGPWSECSQTCGAGVMHRTMKGGVREDGEHFIKVRSKILQIYCAEMQSGFPKDRRQDCACRNDYTAAATDVKFSQTLFGRSVPFASAGDCYSAAKCPQVPSLYFLND